MENSPTAFSVEAQRGQKPMNSTPHGGFSETSINSTGNKKKSITN